MKLSQLIQKTADVVREQDFGTGQEVTSVLAWKSSGPYSQTPNPAFDRTKASYEKALKEFGPELEKEGLKLEVYDEGLASTHAYGPQVFLRLFKSHPQKQG